MNLHPTKKESKQSEGSLFNKDSDQFSAVKRQLADPLRGLEGDVHLADIALL
jgi:hypothetical protein